MGRSLVVCECALQIGEPNDTDEPGCGGDIAVRIDRPYALQRTFRSRKTVA